MKVARRVLSLRNSVLRWLKRTEIMVLSCSTSEHTKLVRSLKLSHHFFNAEGNLIPGAPTKGLVPDPPLQETHLTPTATREEDQSQDLNLPIASNQSFNQPEGELCSLHPLQEAVEVSWSRTQQQ